MAGSNAIYATARAEERNALVRLTSRSDLKGLVQLACHLGALLVTAALVWSARSSSWLLPAMLLHGIVLPGRGHSNRAEQERFRRRAHLSRRGCVLLPRG
jgi:hypothetical protein